MKDHYDFTSVERGKFYHTKESIRIPVYLDPQVLEDLELLIKDNGRDFDTLVNDLLRKDIEILRTMQSDKQQH